MKQNQTNNSHAEQERARKALITIQNKEYIIQHEVQEEIEEEPDTADITFEDIIHEIEKYIKEIKQDPEKMRAMMQQFAHMHEETPTHWKYKNKIYCERCFIKLMAQSNTNNVTVMGMPNNKNAICDICGE